MLLPLPLHVHLHVGAYTPPCVQVRPSERSSITDLCDEPWVAASGALPDEALASQPIPRNGSGSADLENAKGGDHWAAEALGGRRTARRGGGGGGDCKQLVASGGWRRVALYLLYAALVAWALLANRRRSPATAAEGAAHDDSMLGGGAGVALGNFRTST